MDLELQTNSPSFSETLPGLAKIRRINDGFKAFQVLRTGFRSGLFDWLQRHGPAERPLIAAALDLRGAHLAGYLQALEDLGLVLRQDGAYRIAPGMEAVLCSSSPWCQAAVVDDLCASSNGWSSLDRFMSVGWMAAPPSPLPSAQHPFAGEAERLAAHLARRLEDKPVRDMLCFDGGDGLFAAAACRHFPEARITAVVPPEALERAAGILAETGAGDRCRVLPGMPLEPPVGEGMDVAVLFHALYPLRRTTNHALAAVADRLAPGGALYCAHWFCLEACETAPGGLRDLDKAVLTDHHPMCHVETFCERFGSIGLVDAGRDDLAGEYGTVKLHFASRPQSAKEA